MKNFDDIFLDDTKALWIGLLIWVIIVIGGVILELDIQSKVEREPINYYEQQSIQNKESLPFRVSNLAE